MEAENGDALKSKMEDYEVIEQIGRGAFGSAFLVLHKTEQKQWVPRSCRQSRYYCFLRLMNHTAWIFDPQGNKKFTAWIASLGSTWFH